jgi:transcription antitermination protein NusB
MGARRKARAAALQALYEYDATAHDIDSVLSHIIEENKLAGDNAVFASTLVNGVLKNQKSIDEKIKDFAPAWPVAQIPIVDRNILRLAIFEILLDNIVPVKVAISEAVELAKSFGSESSPRFINGVLGSVSKLAAR